MHWYVPNQFAQFAPHTISAAAVLAEQMISRSTAVDARDFMTFGILLRELVPSDATAIPGGGGKYFLALVEGPRTPLSRERFTPSPSVKPEIMIPLVGHVNELKDQEKLVREVAKDVFAKAGLTVDYLVGTMIELPRAALTADEIAQVAEFFSYGMNDLTQTTIGLSRDDAGKFLPDYVKREILPADPFEKLDQTGVGKLVKMGVELGRTTRPKLKIGICGEHGGEPSSVEFCHRTNLDYVSCSPFRIPIARLAAGQAAVREGATVSGRPAKAAKAAAKPAPKKAAPKAKPAPKAKAPAKKAAKAAPKAPVKKAVKPAPKKAVKPAPKAAPKAKAKPAPKKPAKKGRK